MAREVRLPPVEIHLHKQIPAGAGLGGGSSNASLTLRGLNQLAAKPLSETRLQQLAAMLGSDCPFFLNREPMLMEGRGEILTPVRPELGDRYLILLFPQIHVSTAEAYDGAVPARPEKLLRDLIRLPLSRWKDHILNDFEKTVFHKYPQLQEIKQELYRAGASYASMSGSGSALYGIFRQRPQLQEGLKPYVIWEGPTGIQ